MSSEPDDFDAMLDADFSIVRRGFEPNEVRRRLLQLAGELRAGRERELLLSRQLEAAEARAAAVDPLDPEHLTKLLGDEVARILDAARSAATEIRQRADEAALRLLAELKAEADAEAEAEAVPDARAIPEHTASVSDAAVVAGAHEEPARRPRRSGIDPARTNDLFAALREQHDAPSAPARPKASRAGKTSKSSPAATSANDERSGTDARAAQARSVQAQGGPSSSALAATLTRALRRQLTDDLNAVLALVAGTGRWMTPIHAVLPDGAAPTTEQYVHLLEPLLFQQFPPGGADRASVIGAAASAAAHDLVVPLRARIDQLLASGTDDQAALTGSLRALFREWREERVGIAVGAAQALLPQMGDPRTD